MNSLKGYFQGKINVVTIIQLFLAYITPVLAYMGISGNQITDWNIFFTVISLPIKNPYMLMVVLSSVWAVFNNPKDTNLLS